MIEPELLAAILRDPDDLAPREDYARLLDARGDPRGGFILLQIALWEIERAGGPDEAWRVAYRESEARLAAHRAEWEAPLRGDVLGMAFHRGFVEQITVDVDTFLNRAPELYARAPIRHLDLRGVAGRTAEVFASPHLDRIVSLSLWGERVGDAGVRDLAASPHLGRLAWLDLGFNDLTEAALDTLAATDRLPGLRCLVFGGNPAPDPAEAPSVDIDGTVLDVVETELGQRLEARYGRKAWLHAVSSFPPPYPVSRGRF